MRQVKRARAWSAASRSSSQACWPTRCGAPRPAGRSPSAPNGPGRAVTIKVTDSLTLTLRELPRPADQAASACPGTGTHFTITLQAPDAPIDSGATITALAGGGSSPMAWHIASESRAATYSRAHPTLR